jgi:hypothetical protein
MNNKKDIIHYKHLPEVKLRYIYYIFLIIYGIDFLSTIIALMFFDGKFAEANPFQAQFFNLGWYGYFTSLFLTASILFFMVILIGLGGKFVRKFEKMKKTKGYYNIYLFFCCGILCGMEIVVLINNFGLLFGLL